MARAVLVINH